MIFQRTAIVEPVGAEDEDLELRVAMATDGGEVVIRDMKRSRDGWARCARIILAGLPDRARLFLGVPLGSDPAPLIDALRHNSGSKVVRWPEEPWSEARIVTAYVDHTLIDAETAAEAARSGQPADRAWLRLMAAALASLDSVDRLKAILDAPVSIGRGAPFAVGCGHETALRAAVPADLSPPKLRNDCFALPRGVDWVPVDEALSRLEALLHPVTAVERVPTTTALGRILAADCRASRSNPPAANAAVDGFGFAHETTSEGEQRLPLVQGRAAAGQPYSGTVPAGAAIRILTGAILPRGVDTVVLEEDTTSDRATVAFHGPIRRGANTRRAGEDIAAGKVALPSGHLLRPPDLALLTVVGVEEVAVRRRLRVAVLSTGDELVSAVSEAAGPHNIPDANRPMLLALAQRWGYQTIDLGRAPDDQLVIAERLDQGAGVADVVLVSGGASSGDEDHVSRLLRNRGSLSSWRIAIKPGRPLALATWNDVPVFGLPGNPVAAFVCALVFARPALIHMAGAAWTLPEAFTVPAAFSKSKKPGRREYLRARLTRDGRAEVFQSEGSGRISGLSWATGLVELPDEAAAIEPGTPVRFLPYSGFGI